MPPPEKQVKATTYRRDSLEVAKLWLRLVLNFMQLTRDLFAIAKFLFLNFNHTYNENLYSPYNGSIVEREQ